MFSKEDKFLIKSLRELKGYSVPISSLANCNTFLFSRWRHFVVVAGCGWSVGLEFPAGQLAKSDYWREQFQTISEDVSVRNVLMHLAH